MTTMATTTMARTTTSAAASTALTYLEPGTHGVGSHGGTLTTASAAASTALVVHGGRVFPCKGFVPRELICFLAQYPWGLHNVQDVPWEAGTRDGGALFSTEPPCTPVEDQGSTCGSCLRLRYSTELTKAIAKAANSPAAAASHDNDAYCSLAAMGLRRDSQRTAKNANWLTPRGNHLRAKERGEMDVHVRPEPLVCVWVGGWPWWSCLGRVCGPQAQDHHRGSWKWSGEAWLAEWEARALGAVFALITCARYETRLLCYISIASRLYGIWAALGRGMAGAGRYGAWQQPDLPSHSNLPSQHPDWLLLIALLQPADIWVNEPPALESRCPLSGPGSRLPVLPAWGLARGVGAGR